MTGKPCPFGDPYCPCQDGDPCHYVDDPASGIKTMPPPVRMACPDGGTCHHSCGYSPCYRGRCWRVENAGPLSGVYHDDRWPDPAPNAVEVTS